MKGEELDDVAHAAELHDVGKIAIPDAILEKSGPLDETEWGFMRRHTIIGERILMAAPALRSVARLVRSSHERWDGVGYPDGLRGEEIPLGARVVAVCDAFDAMTTDTSLSPAHRRAGGSDGAAPLRRQPVRPGRRGGVRTRAERERLPPTRPPAGESPRSPRRRATPAADASRARRA